MSVERRGQVIRALITLVNWQQEEPIDRGEGRQLFMDDTSRVSREAQARFSEGLGVKPPGLLGRQLRVLSFWDSPARRVLAAFGLPLEDCLILNGAFWCFSEQFVEKCIA